MNSVAVDKTDIPSIPLVARGKVRDIYDLGDKLLIISTDRISAFDVILPQPIPDKGKVLNGLSLFWMKQVEGIVPNHLITADVSMYPEACRRHLDMLQGRSMVVEKAKVIPVECVVRGYLIGSGWKDYEATGRVCGVRLPAGLKQAEKLPQPIFTPSTKAELGTHDENISFDKMADIVGAETAAWLEEKSLEIYLLGAARAEKRGVIIADTKFEFGLINGIPHLIDEVLTPDSSRFWPKDQYAEGMSPPSLDKQFVRDYLETLVWNKQAPAPDLPAEIIRKTREKYLRIYEIITGQPLAAS
jgi:phosphoribosylaminoimidazole-succinocarboxamide synthase